MSRAQAAWRAKAKRIRQRTAIAEILAKVREFAKNDPKVTADIVKEWMAKE